MKYTDSDDMMNKSDVSVVDDIVRKARLAQQRFEATGSQAMYDQAALAAAWALVEPARNQELSELAVATTGLGNVADKLTKNHRKTLGLLQDIAGVTTRGVIEEQSDQGLTLIARPIGVIAAMIPSTNPVATPTNNIINALKCGNAIVLAPSPKGVEALARLLGYIHAEFQAVGLDTNLVQMLPAPAAKDKTQRLMQLADLLVVTGSQDNVRRGYASGTPAIGVGAGNATVIIDETANIDDAAQKITASKTFDNATSCSSENALVVVDAVYDRFIEALGRNGGILLDNSNAEKLKAALFSEGHLNRQLLAQDIDKVIAAAKLPLNAKTTKFLLIPGHGVGAEYPESGEKMSLVTTLYRAHDFEQAADITEKILRHQGAGHSIGLHSSDDNRARYLGNHLPTCRVIVNQAHCFAVGGSFENGMKFSLSMGCGSWGGNSIDDNLHYRHFMNITKIVRRIPGQEPGLEDIFGDYWASKV